MECNAKYRYIKKLTCQWTLRQVFYLSEAPLPSCDPILPPVYTVYFLTQGRVRELTREYDNKTGRKYELTVSPIYKLYF
jgi:hypothetical protein